MGTIDSFFLIKHYKQEEDEFMLKIKTDLDSNRVVERKGNVVHIRYLDSGYESWIDYDEKGHEIHYKDTNGYESWIDYDEYGEAIWCIDNKGGN